MCGVNGRWIIVYMPACSQLSIESMIIISHVGRCAPKEQRISNKNTSRDTDATVRFSCSCLLYISPLITQTTEGHHLRSRQQPRQLSLTIHNNSQTVHAIRCWSAIDDYKTTDNVAIKHLTYIKRKISATFAGYAIDSKPPWHKQYKHRLVRLLSPRDELLFTFLPRIFIT